MTVPLAASAPFEIGATYCFEAVKNEEPDRVSGQATRAMRLCKGLVKPIQRRRTDPACCSWASSRLN